MSAIDQICKQHGKRNQNCFDKAQVEVLKDIAFQIVYTLDRSNR